MSESLLSAYPYLFISLLLLALFLLLFIAAGDQRRPMLWSALLSAPYGFLSIIFVPDYWNPVRIGEWGAGIEDIIFSFANGGIVWFLVTWPLRNRLSLDIQIKRMLRRYLVWTAGGTPLGLFLLFMGADPMHGVLLVLSVMIVVFLWLRSELWPLFLFGAVSFGAMYTVTCIIAFSLNPDFLMQWNIQALSGYYFFGVPLEEIAWSIAFGAVWPLLVAYAFETRISFRMNNPGKFCL